MANMLFANNANTTLASSLTNSATTMSVTSASSFPSPTGVQYFYCTLADAATQTTIEIVKVTAVSGTTFTIVRGQDGTSGTAFASGTVVSLRLVRASLNDFSKLDEPNTFTQLQTINTIAVSGSTSTTPVLSFNASNCPIASGTAISGSYLQFVLQNTSGTASASTNYVLSNDLGTDSSYYGEFGINSSVYSSGTPADFFSINNGVYFSGHDGDITIGSGNGKKLYLAWGTSGGSAHVINASGAIGLNTNLASGTGSGTTNFGTSGQVLTSGGSSATPTWTTPTTGTVTSVAASVPSFLSISGSPITSSGTLAISYSGTALPVANGGTGLTSFTSNGIVYASSTSVLATGSALTFDGTNFATTGYASAASFRPTSSTNPVNGMYLPATNSVAFATNSTLAMYIDSSQNIAVGRISAPIGIFTIKQVADTDAGGLCQIAPNSTNYWAPRVGSDSNFYFSYNGTSKGQINNSTGAYSALSDANSKKDISDISLGLDLINKLRPVQYLMKDESEDSPKHLGFIAQEIQSLIPSSISEFSDGTLAMDKSEIIAVLVKAVQELNNKFDAYVASHP